MSIRIDSENQKMTSNHYSKQPSTRAYGNCIEKAPTTRVSSTTQLDSWVDRALKKIEENISQKKCKLGIVTFHPLWQDDFYAEAFHEARGQFKKSKRDNPIYLTISCSEMNEALLCEPDSLMTGVWCKSLLPLLTHSDVLKVFWDGRKFLSMVAKHLQNNEYSKEEVEQKHLDKTLHKMYSNCISVALALIIKKLYVDSDPIRLKRRVMKLPQKCLFLPKHSDPVKQLLLQSYALLITGADAIDTTFGDEHAWSELTDKSAIFLHVSGEVRTEPLPYVTLDVFGEQKAPSEPCRSDFLSSERKFQRFTVRCVDCARNVQTSLADPVGVTIHGMAKDGASKSPGNLYASYRCRMCSEVHRPCQAYKKSGECSDPECVYIHTLIYCSAGDMCCEHKISQSCPFLHPNEALLGRQKVPHRVANDEARHNITKSGYNDYEADWWTFPRVYLGMPSWDPYSLPKKTSCDNGNEGVKEKSVRRFPALYKIPCPDHFGLKHIQSDTGDIDKKISHCPFAHEPLPVYIPVPILQNSGEADNDNSERTVAQPSSSKHPNCFLWDKLDVQRRVLDSPSFSLEEFMIYFQNMLCELEKIRSPSDSQPHKND